MKKNKQRKHYSDEFKEESLKLAEKVGVAQASTGRDYALANF